MTFSIRVVSAFDASRAIGEISIGDFRETFPLITTLWTTEQYREQWREALDSLSNQKVQRCLLITDIQPPADSVGISCWALFNESGIVHVQERFVRERPHLLMGESLSVEPFIEPRLQGSVEEQQQVSEWQTPIKSISEFCSNL